MDPANLPAYQRTNRLKIQVRRMPQTIQAMLRYPSRIAIRLQLRLTPQTIQVQLRLTPQTIQVQLRRTPQTIRAQLRRALQTIRAQSHLTLQAIQVQLRLTLQTAQLTHWIRANLLLVRRMLRLPILRRRLPALRLIQPTPPLPRHMRPLWMAITQSNLPQTGAWS